MVSGQLRVDPDNIAAAGRDLAAIAQRMADDVASLETAVGASSDPWGADETGSMFALAYRAVRDIAIDAMGSYTEQVGFAAATLVMQARSVEAADAEGASSLYGVTGHPGPASPPVASGGSTPSYASGASTPAYAAAARTTPAHRNAVPAVPVSSHVQACADGGRTVPAHEGGGRSAPGTLTPGPGAHYAPAESGRGEADRPGTLTPSPGTTRVAPVGGNSSAGG